MRRLLSKWFNHEYQDNSLPNCRLLLIISIFLCKYLLGLLITLNFGIFSGLSWVTSSVLISRKVAFLKGSSFRAFFLLVIFLLFLLIYFLYLTLGLVSFLGSLILLFYN